MIVSELIEITTVTARYTKGILEDVSIDYVSAQITSQQGLGRVRAVVAAIIIHNPNRTCADLLEREHLSVKPTR